jgi:iron(III) transport system permease protein
MAVQVGRVSRPGWLRLMTLDPTTYLTIGFVALLLLFFVLYPIVTLISYPKLETWRELLAQPRVWRILRNSLSVAALTTCSATFVGFCFAYALGRPDFPFKGFFRAISILPLISPPFVAGLSFILLFGRRGLVTHSLLGLDLNIYGWHGLWLVQTLTFYPIAVLTLSGVLRAINTTLEYAAHDLGQDSWGVLRTITLPLAIPGIASAGLLVSMYSLADFGNPMLIGGNFRVLATESYVQVTGLYNMPNAATLSIILLIPALTVFLLQRYWVERKQYVTVTGKGGSLEPLPTPPLVKWALLFILGTVSTVMVLVYGVIFLGAFTKTWGVDWTLTTAQFGYAKAKVRDLWNSTWYALVAATGVSLFAIASAYVIHRKKFAASRALDFLAVLPSALPGTMVGIAWVLTFNTGPFAMTGTASIIILNMLFSSLPVGYRSAVSTLQQIDNSIEESASDLGANTLRTLKDIMLPLLKTAFTASIVYAFVKSINTLSAVIFLISPRHNVASVSIMGLAEHGYWGQAAALAAALMTITFTALILFRIIGGGKMKLFDL